MGDRLRNALQNMGHNLELYATVVVCGFLLVLKLLHLVEDHWMYSAILVTLMLLALGNLRDRADEKTLRQTLDAIAAKPNGEGSPRWYTLRSQATADMLEDMGRFKHIAFLGISHRQLASYLRERLQHPTSVLPWESVDVYFASRALGEAYEGTEFVRNVTRARQEIASLLTDPAFAERLPRLRAVAFFQQTGFATHTGSMFGASPREVAVIYAVHSAVHLHGDTHQGLTVRFSASPGLGFRDARFEHYDGIYRALAQSSVRLGVFARSVWDSSALRWSEYARQSNVLRRSAGVVAEMITPNVGDSVLDIGSGSGDSAEAILERHTDLSITLLDGSPQMVRILRERFQHAPRVTFALCQLPSVDRSSIDLGDARFSFIVIHQALGELGRAFGSLDEIAVWCRGRLRPDGQVLVTAHNTLVVTQNRDWNDWADPFRHDLVREFRKVAKASLRVVPEPIEEDRIVQPFLRSGFELKERRTEVIDVNYEERWRLWRVPAVMDSIVDTGAGQSEDHDRIVDRVFEAHKKERAMPRTVIVWRFAAINSHGGQSSDGASEAG